MRFAGWILPLIALLASCATQPTGLPTPPPKAKPVAPQVSRVRDSVATVDKVATVIESNAKEASQAATAARKEAERLKDQQRASAAELEGLWKSLQSVEARNLFLENETQRLSRHLTELGGLTSALEQAAAAKDAEADQLRAQAAQLTETAIAQVKASKAAEKEAQVQRTRADKLAGEIRIYRVVAIGAGVLVLLLIAAKFFLPPRLL